MAHGWTARRRKAAEALLDEYTPDCYDEDERLAGLLVAAEETVDLPTEALVVGVPVVVVGFGIEGDSLPRLVGYVMPEVDDMEKCYSISLADVEFEGTAGARMVDCCRLWRGMEPIEPSGVADAPSRRSQSRRAPKVEKANGVKPAKPRKTGRPASQKARKKPPRKKRPGVLERVREFDASSRKHDYFESFSVNSRNWTERSEGTELWIDECVDLMDRCVEASGKGQHAEAAAAFEILFDLLREIDTGNDSIIFFADETGSWQVGIDWDVALPAYFTSLATVADPDPYARSAVRAIDDFVEYARPKFLTSARRPASPEQKRAIKELLRG